MPQDTVRKVYQSYKVHNGTSASAEARAGMEALMKYFDKHVSQSVVTEDGVHSKMIMQIVFNQGGELAEVKVLEGVDAATDAEAVRVMRNIPRSVSEKLKGDTISFAFTVPVKFSVTPLKEGMRQSGSVVTISEKSSRAKRTSKVPRLEDYGVPEFPGGREAEMKFLAENMRYPQEAREKGIEGKVIVKFTVSDETGEIQNPRVVRSVHPALDAEALRLVKAMPRWTVAKDPDKGKLKSVEIEMPIEFKLDGQPLSKVYDKVNELPQFPGGNHALFQFIKDNQRYPQIAKESGIQGRVILQFVVDETGKVSDPKVLRSVDPSLDAEAIRIVKAMPRWTPGMQDGKAVAVRYTLPVNFSLGDKKAADSGRVAFKLKESDRDNEFYKHLGILAVSTPNGISVNPNSICIVIDGVVATPEMIRSLTPQQVDGISVLDGEKSLKKYGDRAKNGVLQVTTKQQTEQAASAE